uniref:Interferon-inducible GTPase 5-like n=1 Tax=Gadus morhua TaxID=8049 RepID=A0A8C5AJY0_GADMO
MSTLESEVFEDLEKALEDLDLVSAVSIIKYLEDINNISLNIAVTGESGVGKSTVVNAFRGIDNTDERAAPTGVETTKTEPYPHPIYPNVTLWDLPGIGTTNFPADQYLERSGFENVDFFIIVSAGRFRENDAKLAQEIKKMGKKFYFVRSKIDNNLSDAKRGQREYDEERTLQEIRENCIHGLKKQGVASPQVFLVSSFDLDLYDFPALQDTMERELPSHKRDVLNRGIPKVCKSIINKKKEVFRSQIWYYALISSTVAAVPLPGLSFTADLGILVSVLTNYLNGFGLDEKSLAKLSSDTNTPLEDLRAEMKCLCSGQNVSIELVSLMLYSLPLLTEEAAKVVEGSRWIPLLGIPIAASSSFTFITSFLTSTLDSLSVDAESVLIKFKYKYTFR